MDEKFVDYNQRVPVSMFPNLLCHIKRRKWLQSRLFHMTRDWWTAASDRHLTKICQKLIKQRMADSRDRQKRQTHSMLKEQRERGRLTETKDKSIFHWTLNSFEFSFYLLDIKDQLWQYLEHSALCWEYFLQNIPSNKCQHIFRPAQSVSGNMSNKHYLFPIFK